MERSTLRTSEFTLHLQANFAAKEVSEGHEKIAGSVLHNLQRVGEDLRKSVSTSRLDEAHEGHEPLENHQPYHQRQLPNTTLFVLFRGPSLVTVQSR